jgi:hypothetical protein
VTHRRADTLPGEREGLLVVHSPILTVK